MKKIVAICILISLLHYGCKKEKAPCVVQVYNLVQIDTDSGSITIWLYDSTPIHKHNFDSLTRTGFFDGLLLHRIVNDFVIQGGDPTGVGTGGPGYTLPAEIRSDIKHLHGAVGAARNNNPEKRSNGSQFYIVEDKNGEPGLDGNYTVFGQTIDGLEVVSALASVKTNTRTGRPLEDVKMNKITMVPYTTQELLDNFGFTVP